MNVYMFQAALYCDKCGLDLPAPPEGLDENQYDSDKYRKGPYPNGGGEADYPNHCDACGEFLENPLTGDGEEYVKQCVREYSSAARKIKDSPCIEEWQTYYSYLLE